MDHVTINIIEAYPIPVIMTSICLITPCSKYIRMDDLRQNDTKGVLSNILLSNNNETRTKINGSMAIFELGKRKCISNMPRTIKHNNHNSPLHKGILCNL